MRYCSNSALVTLSLVVFLAACSISKSESRAQADAAGGATGQTGTENAAGTNGESPIGSGGEQPMDGVAGAGGIWNAAASAGAQSGDGLTSGEAGYANQNLGGTAGTNSGAAIGFGTAGRPDICAPIVNQMVVVPPVLMFQIDISGSMELATAMTNGTSKWAATKDALTSALLRLPAEWAVGVTFFNKGTGCYSAAQETTVPAAPLDATQLGAINAAIEAQRPSGGTPTQCAWQTAATSLAGFQLPPGSAYNQSRRFVVLLTDGVPTVNRDCCSLGTSTGGNYAISAEEYRSFVSAVRDLTEAQAIRTFVIGVPGSEDAQTAEYDPRCMLSALAEAGGTATPSACTSTAGANSCSLASGANYCHVDLTAAKDFSNALEDVIVNRIAHTVTSCNYTVPVAQADTYVDVKRTSIQYSAGSDQSPQTLVAASSAACTDGDYYFYMDARGRISMVNLCPKKCEEVQGNSQAQLKVQFACVVVG